LSIIAIDNFKVAQGVLFYDESLKAIFYVMFNKRVGVFYHNIKHDA
jgi:hypothetical protein